MTLTELRYVVALAQERHFGRAAQKCFVTQPTLSLALAKLEDELGARLFERNKNEVLVTARGAAIVEQARRVLDEVGYLKPKSRKATLVKLRRLMMELGLTNSDAKVLGGILAQIEWKLERMMNPER